MVGISIVLGIRARGLEGADVAGDGGLLITSLSDEDAGVVRSEDDIGVVRSPILGDSVDRSEVARCRRSSILRGAGVAAARGSISSRSSRGTDVWL